MLLDVYDQGGGSVLLAWQELLQPPASSYNLYFRTVTATPVYTPGTDAFDQSAGPVTYSTGPWVLLGVPSAAGEIELASGLGAIELAAGGGALALVGLMGPSAHYLYTVSGLTVASYNPATGVISPSGTYDFVAVALAGTQEVMPTNEARVTCQPSSIMLKTPMKRLWPFPNTGLD